MSDEGDRSSAPPRALRMLVDDLRAEEPPELDWGRIEARLSTQLEIASLPRRGASAPHGESGRGVNDRARDGAAGESITAGGPVDTSGVVDLLGPQPSAEILVPWDDELTDDDWREVRRPPTGAADPGEIVRARTDRGETDRGGTDRGGTVSGGTDRGGADRGGADRGGADRGEPDARRAVPRADLAAGPAAARAPSAGRQGSGPVGWGRRAVRWGAPLAAAASVAAAGWWLLPWGTDTRPTDPVDLASVARQPRLGGALDLASLRAGDVVEAAEGPVHFGREGLMAWTLAAGGRLRVVRGIGHGDTRHVVALESGAIDVEVVPVVTPSVEERFVVEVGGARVAVHGTAFRVVRSTQGIVVDVARGVVAVGPRGGAPGSGHRLEAPHRAAFAMDGGGYRQLPARLPTSGATADERYAGFAFDLQEHERRGAPAASESGDGIGPLDRPTSDPPSDPAAAPEASPRLPGSSASARPGAPPGGPAPAGDDGAGRVSPPGTTSWSRTRMTQEVQACIVRTGASSSATRVTLSTTLVVDVDDGGSARSVRFDPPIRPELQACAQSLFHGRFPSPGRIEVPLEIVLEPRSPR